ncbi:MAG: hypothetical protein K0S37_4402 [Microbacterium sp.]|nr:hypothetical protein [Microbacterium sp.]
MVAPCCAGSCGGACVLGPTGGTIWFALLTIDTEQEVPDDLYGWMAAQAAAGVSEVVLKSAERKGGVWAVPVSTETFRNHDAVLDALGWAAVRLDGRRGALLGQPKLQLQYEYRCFVVDGQVVTAAGCVEEFTPLDAIPGQPFDTRVRRHRGHLGGTASPITDELEVVGRLLELGRRAAEEHGGTVVINVALDAERQRPVVVELNGLPNSGLYASDPWLLARALKDAADRGY